MAPRLELRLNMTSGTMNQTTYTATGIKKAFGATVALDNVSITVKAGTIVGLVGGNGAGKSTFMRILAGAIAPDAGEINIGGKERMFSSTRDAVASGVAIVSQELSLFPELTVEENLLFGGGEKWSSRADLRRRAQEILDNLGFAYRVRDLVKILGQADRQLVEIARALLSEPRFLILDEPTSALHTGEVARLHDQLRRLRDTGVGVIYVSHFLEDLLDVCDEIIVLRNGKCVPSLDLSLPDKLSCLVSAMLGDVPPDAKTATQNGIAEEQKVAFADELSISRLRGRRLQVDHLIARPGEIVGLAGLAGSGVSELFSTLFGMQRPTSGAVTLPSKRPLQRTPADAVHAGVAYVPPDRKSSGLMLRQSIAENVISVRALAQGRDGFLLDRSALIALAKRRCEEIGVKMSSVKQIVGTLSGGNQQKVLFAKWLEANPSLLLLDDPTRGIDLKARNEIHHIVRRLGEAGLVVLYHSSDPAEIITVADRIHIFVDGVLSHELSGDSMTEHNLVTLMNSSSPQRMSTGVTGEGIQTGEAAHRR